MKMNLEKQIQAKEAIDFLRNHPALTKDINSSISDGFNFWMEVCCKNGLSEFSKKEVKIYYSEENYNKYKSLFDIENEQYSEEEDTFVTPLEFRYINVPYEEVYNEPWKADHMEYWYDITFSVFYGNPYIRKENYDIQNWHNYVGPSGFALSFDDMVIDAASKIKKHYGDFNCYDSFITEEEKKCHEQNEPFFSKPYKKGLSELIFNDQYVTIEPGLKNLRWLKWFIENAPEAEQWELEVKQWMLLIEKIDKFEPIERKKILEKYK